MADITWSQVVALAPDVSAVGTDAQTMLLAYVNAIDSDLFDGDDGPNYLLARIWLAAHLGTFSLPGLGSASGAVTSESAGGLSRSYAVAAASADALGRTNYGQNYLNLLSGSFARLPMVF